MSRENIEVVDRTIGGRRLSGTDQTTIAAFVDRLDPNVEYEEDPAFPEAAVYSGRDDVLGYYRQFIAEFQELRFEVEELVDAGGDGVLALLRMHGRGKGSGAAFDFRPAWVFRVHDGRVVRIRAYLDRAEALRATGLDRGRPTDPANETGGP
jgi:ketosteroid isomerase-like protein